MGFAGQEGEVFTPGGVFEVLDIGVVTWRIG